MFLTNKLPLENVDSIKYLGVHFDYGLKFVEYIYHVNNSIRKLLYKF